MRGPGSEGPAEGPVRVAVEVSAFGAGTHDERAFVEFALAALAADPAVSTSTWSLRWLRGDDRTAARTPSRRGWLAARASILGLLPAAAWAAPRTQLCFLASGPALVRMASPGVVTIHAVDQVQRIETAPRSRRFVGEALRRAADSGVLVHTTSHVVADAAVSQLGLDRASVVIALPGIAPATRSEAVRSEAIGVVAGTNPARDAATLDVLRDRGVPAELIHPRSKEMARPCVVFASPRDGFPFCELLAMTSDTPVVASRSDTTAEILEGAIVLVDPGRPTEIADARSNSSPMPRTEASW